MCIAGSAEPILVRACIFAVMLDKATQYYRVFTHKTKDASAEVVMEAFNGLQ
jgi:hypothetical protein